MTLNKKVVAKTRVEALAAIKSPVYEIVKNGSRPCFAIGVLNRGRCHVRSLTTFVF